jgi:hypothetical protein
MSDRDFWIIIRRALLMVVAAIEKRYDIKSNRAILPTE